MIYSLVPGAIRICCDECEHEPENVGFISVREAALWARENGWTNRKAPDGEWETFCPDCSKANAP